MYALNIANIAYQSSLLDIIGLKLLISKSTAVVLHLAISAASLGVVPNANL